MSQPIDVGAVLGGRYKVSGVVLASADGDVVLDGTDQVLNRAVSILVASSENASQVATSAREIATGERYGSMQVLDLGISDGSTYLITNNADPADLLDLVIQRDEPFVEPFYTDTLGSEIFGETRSMEPHVYDDDDEYYEEQRAQEENRPGVMDRLPEINLTERLSGLKARFGKGRDPEVSGGDAAPLAAGAGAVAAAGAGADPREVDTDSDTQTDTGHAPVADRGTPDQPAGQAPAGKMPPRPKAEPRSASASLVQDEDAQAGTSTQAQPAAPHPHTAAHPTSSKVSIYDDGTYDHGAEAADRQDTGSIPTAAAGAAAATGAVAAGAARTPVEENTARKASVFPASARNYQQPSEPAEYADDDYEDDDESNGGKRATRLIVGAVLGILLVLAVVFAFNNLGSDAGPGPVAGDSAEPSEGTGSAAPPSGSPAASEAPVVEPQIAGLTRVVPGNQALNAETDSTLANAIDGSQGSLYSSYSYTQPQFGGFASNMVLVVELQEQSDVSSVELSGLNGTGGAFEIRVGDSSDLGSATEVTSASFTGPTVTVPVTGDDGGPAKAQYVFINVTELPRLASTSNNSRPYGLQVAEIKVS